MTYPHRAAGLLAALLLTLTPAARADDAPQPAPRPTAAPAHRGVPYGANKAASGHFTRDGVTFYYETYGKRRPLLLVHGNGGSIGTLAAQIDFFKSRYRVVAMDSRDQGRSTDSGSAIDYDKMTDDLAALIDHLKLGQVDVVGWSDGGIEALLLGLKYPDKVRKIVSMAANLDPGPGAIYPETDQLVRDMLAALPEKERDTPEGRRTLKVAGMMLQEPHIDPKSLAGISAPTLVLGSDHDLIRLEHIVEIYDHLPNAQLAIFPDSTHLVPFDNPALFNGTVQRFLSTPFKKKDRIPDTMASFEKMMGGLAH